MGVLERGQNLVRLKELYEVEFPQTKQGMRNAQTSKNAESAFLETPTFTKDIAEKMKKSERVIQEEVQIATRIPEKVQTLIKDLPVADNKSD